MCMCFSGSGLQRLPPAFAVMWQGVVPKCTGAHDVCAYVCVWLGRVLGGGVMGLSPKDTQLSLIFNEY